jgi:hypothetical protein
MFVPEPRSAGIGGRSLLSGPRRWLGRGAGRLRTCGCTGGVPCIDLRCTRTRSRAPSSPAVPRLCAVTVVAHGHRVGLEGVGKLSCVGGVESVRQDSFVLNHRHGGFEIASSPVQQRRRR